MISWSTCSSCVPIIWGLLDPFYLCWSSMKLIVSMINCSQTWDSCFNCSLILCYKSCQILGLYLPHLLKLVFVETFNSSAFIGFAKLLEPMDFCFGSILFNKLWPIFKNPLSFHWDPSLFFNDFTFRKQVFFLALIFLYSFVKLDIHWQNFETWFY